MVPNSVDTFVFFLLLVVPGIVFEIIYERSRPPRRTTVFREICNVTLVGTVASLISVSVLVLVELWLPNLLVNFSQSGLVLRILTKSLTPVDC